MAPVSQKPLETECCRCSGDIRRLRQAYPVGMATMESTEHDDQATCGEGLAANAALPAKLAELIAARAEVLQRHTKAVDPTDVNGKEELDAYTTLVRAHRAIATELAGLAQQMAGYRDLPTARHDAKVMSDPNGQMEAFRRFV